MTKRLMTFGMLLGGALCAHACNSSSASDPATSQRSALNPPTGLVSLTGDQKLTLLFNGVNTEKDMQGYDIFVVADKTLADLTGGKTYYPASANIDPVVGVSRSIPRCKDNTALFEAFGFKASTKDCEGGGNGGDGTTTTSSSLALDNANTTATTDADQAPTQMAICDENTTDKGISLVLKKSLGPDSVVCTISKTADGKALVNGTTYSAFAVAVSGDKKNTLSWTSNFIQDTPATPLFSGKLTFAPGKVFLFNSANLSSATFTPYDPAATSATLNCSAYPATVSGQTDSSVCKINNNNTVLEGSTTDGFYLGRLGTGGYPARVLLSTPRNGKIKILPRGNRLTLDQATGNADKNTPGKIDDQANENAAVYDGNGTLYPVTGFQVFDILVTTGDSKHFGKIIVGAPSVTGDAPAADSVVTLPVTIIMQAKADSVDYFTGS